ncbi:hypothetical protein MTR67_035305 [Solanum verrucosum]|uniref:RNase H type-1 domain-containing protein n=1 Tax=Solanum verrucosum TaxID=315347 RepID=A0AAF0U9L4_SOLVR|nr:hypothetical protein MTR67_035305 [Solanum verrucosum]
MIMSFVNLLQFSTNNFSKVKDALNGIQWCCEKGMYNFKVELNSMIIVHMIQGTCSTHWKLTCIIEEIRDKSYRKAN